MRTLPIREYHQDEPNCVPRVPIFSGLAARQQTMVASLARPVMLSPGDLVYGPGENSRQISVVHTGQIKLSRTMPSGRQRLVRVAKPHETLGEHTFFSGGITLDEAEALTEAELCTFRHEDLADLVNDYPDIAVRMLKIFSDRLAQTERDLTLASLSVDVRLADFLLQQPPVRGVIVQLPLPKKDIASLLGTTPESFSRALTRLESNMLIGVDGDFVSILDPAGLEEMVATA